MTEETRQDKRSHIDSVCAEFGDLASARERDFLFDELLPNEVVLVVIKGEVPVRSKPTLHGKGNRDWSCDESTRALSWT